MKLPEKLATRHKIRDARICMLYANGDKTVQEISELFNLSTRRIYTIVYKNPEFLKTHKEYEKTKRIAHLKRLLNKHPENIGKKDTLDILDQLRVETEGNKADVRSVEYHKTVINYPTDWRPKEEREDNSKAISSRLPLQ